MRKCCRPARPAPAAHLGSAAALRLRLTLSRADEPTPLEADPEVARRIVLGAGQLEVHGDRLGHAADGQVTGDLEVGLVDLLHPDRGAGDGRVVLSMSRNLLR